MPTLDQNVRIGNQRSRKVKNEMELSPARLFVMGRLLSRSSPTHVAMDQKVEGFVQLARPVPTTNFRATKSL